MTKKQSFILWFVLGASVLWLLWRNREKVAPQIFNVAQPNYLDVAYPQMQVSPTPIQSPLSGASCGCNPESSKYMSGVAGQISEAEKKIEEQLKQYTDSINNYFATQTVQ